MRLAVSMCLIAFVTVAAQGAPAPNAFSQRDFRALNLLVHDELTDSFVEFSASEPDIDDELEVDADDDIDDISSAELNKRKHAAQQLFLQFMLQGTGADLASVLGRTPPDSVSLRAVDMEHNTLLEHAARACNLDMTRSLLRRGASKKKKRVGYKRTTECVDYAALHNLDLNKMPEKCIAYESAADMALETYNTMPALIHEVESSSTPDADLLRFLKKRRPDCMKVHKLLK